MEASPVRNGKLYVTREGNVYRDAICTRPAAIVKTSRGGRYRATSYMAEKGKQVSAYVHRLVAEAYIPNPCGYPQVNHKDGNPSNNNSENLEWCTSQQNIAHAYHNGLIHNGTNAKACTACGANTYMNDALCPKCRKAERDLKRNEAKRSTISVVCQKALAICTLSRAQKRYATLGARGYSITEISRACGVSRQCASKAIKVVQDKLAISCCPTNRPSVRLYGFVVRRKATPHRITERRLEQC